MTVTSVQQFTTVRRSIEQLRRKETQGEPFTGWPSVKCASLGTTPGSSRKRLCPQPLLSCWKGQSRRVEIAAIPR